MRSREACAMGVFEKAPQKLSTKDGNGTLTDYLQKFLQTVGVDTNKSKYGKADNESSKNDRNYR